LVLHQKLTDFERVEVWRRIRQNDIKVLIGTRNALFLPFQNLGLIVVDEEHDSAYRPEKYLLISMQKMRLWFWEIFIMQK
jgi:primosomal protein N'